MVGGARMGIGRSMRVGKSDLHVGCAEDAEESAYAQAHNQLECKSWFISRSYDTNSSKVVLS